LVKPEQNSRDLSITTKGGKVIPEMLPGFSTTSSEMVSHPAYTSH
jgi:hypothetical protein